MFKFKKTRRFIARALGVKAIKAQHHLLTQVGKSLFKVNKVSEQHSFDALSGLGIDAQKIAKAYKHFRRLYRFFAVVSICLFFYFLYLLAYARDYASAIICFAVICITLAQTFKNHFWCVQISKKQLGLSFKDYCNSLFGESGGSE